MGAAPQHAYWYRVRQGTTMGFFRKGLAAIFTLLFIITMPLTLIVVNAGRLLLDPGRMENTAETVIEETDGVEAVLAWQSQRDLRQRMLADPLLLPTDDREVAWQMLDFMTLAEWRALRDAALTDATLNEWASSMLAGFYTWIDGTEPLPQFHFDTTSLKTRLAGPTGDDTFAILYGGLPECTVRQVAYYEGQIAAGADTAFPLCAFPADQAGAQQAQYRASFDFVVADDIPDTVTLSFSEDALIAHRIAQPEIKLSLRLGSWMVYGLWALPLMLFLLLIGVVGRVRSEFGWWLGLALGVGGLLSIGAASGYVSIISSALRLTVMSDAPLNIMAALSPAIELGFAPVFTPITLQTLPFLALALIFLSVAVFSRTPVQTDIDQGAEEEVEMPPGLRTGTFKQAERSPAYPYSDDPPPTPVLPQPPARKESDRTILLDDMD